MVLSTRNLQQLDKHVPLKLRRLWVGPFKVEKVVSRVAYWLSLPPGWKIWPVFHVSNLKRFRRSNEFVREDQPLPPILVDGEESTRSRGFFSIRVMVPNADIWCCGNDAWTWWIVGLFECPASCCLSCLRAPWTWGLFMCFCALFSPSM